MRIIIEFHGIAASRQVLGLPGAIGGEIGFNAVLLVAQVCEGAVVTQGVVVSIAIAVQGAQRHRTAQVAVVTGGVAVAPEAVVTAAVDFQPGAVAVAAAGDDVDYAAHGAVAVQGGAGTGQYFDALNGRQGNAGQFRGGQVDVGESAAVQQDQGVLVAGGAEAEQIHAGVTAVDAIQATALQAAHGVE